MKAKEMEKLIGQVIEIIYEDKSGKITQRSVEVHGIKGELLRATCLTSGEPRVFRTGSILAWRRAKARHAG
jgi:predicted DNA-binding transcriptional regulator YafY